MGSKGHKGGAQSEDSRNPGKGREKRSRESDKLRTKTDTGQRTPHKLTSSQLLPGS